MVSASPKECSSVQVGREIREGGAFIAQTTQACARIIGADIVAASTELVLQGSEPVRKVGLIRMPLYEVNTPSDLQLILQHRAVPRELSNFMNVKGTKHALGAENYRTPNALRRRGMTNRYLPYLRDVFTEIAAAEGQSLEGHRITFDKVELLPNSGRDRLIGLRPKFGEDEITTKVIHAQSRAVRERLEIVNPRLANIRPPWSNAVIAVRVFEKVKQSKVDRLLDDMRDKLPWHMVLGGIMIGDEWLM